jgi:hypothetical protein
MPPDPKPPSRRRRRNPVPGEGQLPAQGRTTPAPPLAKGFAWLEWTREYWATIWASPMATRWTDYDVPALTRLAMLQQRALIDDDRKVLGEVRQLEDRFGLSPRGRRLLGWEIVGETSSPTETTGHEASDDASAVATDDASSGVDARQVERDPRLLRLVSGGS